MSTKEVLNIVKERGLEIVLKDGRPVISKPAGNDGVTDRLLSVLKRHRERIIEELSKGESHGNP